MTATIELSSARRKLSSALGDERSKEYFFHLKQWFRRRLTKEEFDAEARKILPSAESHLHNEFLLAVLNKCQTLANMGASPSKAANTASPASSVDFSPKKEELLSPQQPVLSARSPHHGVAVAGSDRLKRGRVKRKSRSGRVTFDQRFIPTSSKATAEEPTSQIQIPEERQVRYIYQEPALPDVAMVHGRALVAAWEDGLDNSADEAAQLLMLAVETQLKKMVHALVAKRKGYRLRDNRFPHAIGLAAPNPWTLNVQRRPHGATLEVTDVLTTGADDPLAPHQPPPAADVEQKSLYEVATAGADVLAPPATLFDLLAVMLEHKALVPCHSVYSLNVERIMARLHHEDEEYSDE